MYYTPEIYTEKGHDIREKMERKDYKVPDSDRRSSTSNTAKPTS